MSKRLVIAMAIATGVAVASNYYAQPLLHNIARTFHAGTSEAGLLVTLSQIGYAAGLVFVLPLGDLFERRRLVTVTSLATALAMAGAALAPSMGALLALAAVIGATSVVAQVLVPFGATLAADSERGKVVGTIMSGLLIGILLARTMAGYVAQAGNWRTVYWVGSALMVLVALAMRLELPVYKENTALGYGRLLLSVLKIMRDEPVLRLRSAYGALGFGAFSILWTSLAFLLSSSRYHYSSGTIGLFGLVGAAGALMAQVAGRLADRGKVRLLTGVTSVALGASFVVIWEGERSLLALIFGIILLDLAAQGLHITNQTQIYRLSPNARSRITAAYMTAYFIGGALGSAGSAIVYSTHGWAGVSMLGVGFGGAATIIWLATLFLDPSSAGALSKPRE